MATPSNVLFASTRRSHSLGLWVVGGILFVISIGGTWATLSAYQGLITEAPVVTATVHVA